LEANLHTPVEAEVVTFHKDFLFLQPIEKDGFLSAELEQWQGFHLFFSAHCFCHCQECTDANHVCLSEAPLTKHLEKEHSAPTHTTTNSDTVCGAFCHSTFFGHWVNSLSWLNSLSIASPTH